MGRSAALYAAVLVCLSLLAVVRSLARSRRRRKLNLGEVSQQWLTEHIDHGHD